MNILEQIAQKTRERVQRDQQTLPLAALKEQCIAGGRAEGAAFVRALKAPGMRFICEIKKASPSKGVIDPTFDYLSIADCISCLTEPHWFLGSDPIFQEIRQTVKTPMLRKDFTVDEYQIYQAKQMGANAVLLICALLDTAKLARYLELCDALGLAALVETHNAGEIESAVAAGAALIGVNNRNLKDFSVDFTNAARLRDRIPSRAVYVAESGVHSPEDVATLHAIGADAVLIGEMLMRAPDKGALLAALREAAR